MKAQDHVLEYAKTGRAKCHGGCANHIAQGTLRYGMKQAHHEYGETTIWSHWECASKALRNLAGVNLGHVPGFRALRRAFSSQDQERVRRDVKARKILPMVSTLGPSSSQTSVQPSSSQPADTSSYTDQTTGQKRKRLQEAGTRRDPIMADEDDEYFDSSQEEAKDELYIEMTAKIVGIQYYKGLVGPGEEVTLVREPYNKYDRNAIQVLNISGLQVGHIPRNVAEKLAPLIDSNQVAVEGVMHEGNIGSGAKQYSLSMTLKIYGPSHKRAQLEPVLIWATPRQRGFTDSMRPSSQSQPLSSQSLPPTSQPLVAGPSSSRSSDAHQRAAQQKADLQKAIELRSLLSSLEKVDDEGRRASLLDIVCPTEDILNIPTHPNPPSIAGGQLKVDLLRHQSQALQWCIDRENPILPKKESDKPVQFWQYKNGTGSTKAFYLNLVTHSPQTSPPILGRGGLMADAMGLGKTLAMLALVVATKMDVSEQFSGATLIVVPVSVMSNWRTQINDHFTQGSLTYHLYYEAGRSISPEKLATYDVVITSYQTVTTDFNSSGGLGPKDGVSAKKRKLEEGLFGVKWKRIILDEGHTIRNPKTKMSFAVKALEAERRWVVSGTPIINSPKDLGSLLQFLRICHPLDNEEYFKRLVLRPIAQGFPQGAELLKAVMSHICIRRTKEMQNEKGEYLVPLPPVEMTLIPVTLDEATRKLYDEVEALSQQRFTSIMQTGPPQPGGPRMPSNVLSLLTRLRQLTLHPGLMPRNYLEQLRAMSLNSDPNAPPLPAMPITPQDRIRLQAILARAIEDSEECPVCFEVSNDPRITPCAHIFCLACITEVLSRDSRCPMDRRTINISDLVVPPPPTDLTQAPPPREEEEDEDFTSSPKIDQLIHLLQLTPKNEKSLVFSQFTAFLSKIGEALDQAGFDGQMSARRRNEVLERFDKPLQDQESSGNIASSDGQRRPLRSRSKQNMSDFIVEDKADEGEDFVPSDDHDIDDDSEDDRSKKSKGKSKKNKKIDLNDSWDLLDNEGNPVVMLISLKAGALGLNLTVANNVYLMDPWWQEGIESQAIDRCNRIGQKKTVHVYQLVAEDTVEAKVLEIQDRKKNLIREAFSGLRSTETQRQKKEARIQDLIELFGARRNANPQTST